MLLTACGYIRTLQRQHNDMLMGDIEAVRGKSVIYFCAVFTVHAVAQWSFSSRVVFSVSTITHAQLHTA